jgi:hypothetical protein
LRLDSRKAIYGRKVTTRDLEKLIARDGHHFLDRLLQTTLRRTRVRPAVSRPLYPPRRHLQPSPDRVGRRPGYPIFAEERTQP